MTPEIQKKIEDMFDEGHGAATISRIVKVSYFTVAKHLKATGRYRTHAEAHAVRVNSKAKKTVRA